MNAITYTTFTRLVDMFVELGINEGIFSKELESSNRYNSAPEIITYHQKKALVAELILVSLYEAGGQITEDEHSVQGKDTVCDQQMRGYQMGYVRGSEETKEVMLEGFRQFARDYAAKSGKWAR